MNDSQQGYVPSVILVIEDNAAQLKTLSDIFETEGLEPIGCQTGRETLEACQQHDVHVAILDLKLPCPRSHRNWQAKQYYLPAIARIHYSIR